MPLNVRSFSFRGDRPLYEEQIRAQTRAPEYVHPDDPQRVDLSAPMSVFQAQLRRAVRHAGFTILLLLLLAFPAHADIRPIGEMNCDLLSADLGPGREDTRLVRCYDGAVYCYWTISEQYPRLPPQFLACVPVPPRPE